MQQINGNSAKQSRFWWLLLSITACIYGQLTPFYSQKLKIVKENNCFIFYFFSVFDMYWVSLSEVRKSVATTQSYAVMRFNWILEECNFLASNLKTLLFLPVSNIKIISHEKFHCFSQKCCFLF